MTYTTWKIEHTPFINNAWDDGDKTTLTTYFKPLVQATLGDGRDSFNFNMLNRNGEFDNFFNPNDKIVISRTANTDITTTDDILMIGTVKDVPETQTSGKKQLKVEGFNFSETVMNAIVFVDLNGIKINDALELALNNASNKNTNFAVTWNTNNPSKLSDGTTDFPIITSDSRYFNKQLKKIIEKYSTIQATGDGNYYWYVDENNTFVWRQQDDVDIYEFNAGTDNYKKIKIGKDTKGVRNYVILKGGVDPQNNQIQTKYIDWSSVSINGMRYHILISENNNAKDLIYDDLVLDYGVNEIGNNSYPAFPFTSTWVSSATGSTVTAADEDEYIEVVRAHIKAALLDEGKKFTDSLLYGKLKVELMFRAGEKTWGLGDNITCTIPQIRDLPFTLRVSDIQYTNTTDTYTLEEDIGSIGKGE